MSDSSDSSSFAGRLTRMARVSTTMAGLGARLAGEKYFGLKIDREDHARALKDALGNLKGPLMKVAQLLATIPDAVPQEYMIELAQLQSNAPPMGRPFVKRRMQSELGSDWESKFHDFDYTAAAAASLGQVHRATAIDGSPLACKLQYPDMASSVDADVRQLKIILNIYSAYDKAVRADAALEEIAARLAEELDYTREARNIALYRDILRDEPCATVPETVANLCTSRLLTMRWLDGNKILDYTDAPLETRNQIAENLFRTWYVPFYFYGTIHGDPHLGNYSIRPDFGINLLDFGCVRVFPPKFVQGVLDLYRALRTDDFDLACHAYQTWGFDNLTRETAEVLNVWARFIYGPILDDSERLLGEANGTIYGKETAEKVHAELRRVGGVKIPREFVFMDRAALGLGSVFIHLKARVNWHRMFEGLIDGFDLDALSQRQAKILTLHGLSPSP